MIRLTSLPKICVGLCGLLLSLAGASEAQASVWMVNGANLNAGSKPIKGSLVSNTGTLDTTIGGNAIKVTCTGMELIEMGLDPNGQVTPDGHVRFTGCTMAINGATTGVCKPNHNGTEPGVILTNQLKGHLMEHLNGEGVVVFESLVNEIIEGAVEPVFAHIFTSEECALGEDIPVIGPKFAVLDVKGMGESAAQVPGTAQGILHEQAAHVFKEFASLTEIWVLSLTVEHRAKLLGEAKVETVAAGNTWSGLLP